MRHIKQLLVFPLFSLSLFSCGDATIYPTNKYQIEMDYHDDFKIMLLTDIHYGVEANIKEQNDQIKRMVDNEKKIDLIVIDGDSFLDANKSIVNSFVDFFDSLNIKWAYTFGNHDLQGDYDYYYINEKISEAKNSVFVDFKDDNIYGLTNYFIDLKAGNDIKYRLYIIDSNTYFYTGLKYSYDVIHDDQLEHIKNIYSSTQDKPEGLAFFHIPLIEFQEAYDEAIEKKHKYQGLNNEKCCPGYKNNGAYDVLKSIGVKAIFCGHDHLNYSDVNYNDEMILSYGVKTTNLIYHDDEIMGYKMITLPNNPESFGLENIEAKFLKYE